MKFAKTLLSSLAIAATTILMPADTKATTASTALEPPSYGFAAPQSRYRYYPQYRNSGFNSRAQQQGYNDGFQRGAYDRRIGVRRPNPTGQGAFQHALSGWEPRWGSSHAYRSIYRQAFLSGYRQGYSRGW